MSYTRCFKFRSHYQNKPWYPRYMSNNYSLLSIQVSSDLGKCFRAILALHGVLHGERGEASVEVHCGVWVLWVVLRVLGVCLNT